MPQDPVLLDGPALAVALGVTPELIRQWATRGKLTRQGTDQHGRTMYDYTQALHVQAQMRRRRATRRRVSDPTGPATSARPATGSGPDGR